MASTDGSGFSEENMLAALRKHAVDPALDRAQFDDLRERVAAVLTLRTGSE